MPYPFQFRAYQRPFKHSLSTSHGIWDIREGIILCLTDETGRIGWGEIAPIPWFGSESLQQAWDFCQQLPSELTATDIFSIPAELPACQFGFECAWEMGGWGDGGDGGDSRNQEVFSSQSSSPSPPSSPSSPSSPPSPPSPSSPSSPPESIAYSCLLPTGEAALESWQTLWSQGYRTFKWKIGVAPIEDELQGFHQLIQSLPPSVQLRLDANGGLNQQEAHRWLEACDQAAKVEFLEQPLTPQQFDAMLEMSGHYSTPIALDESVATLDQLESCFQRGWRGIFVIKAAIAGSPKRLRQFCQSHAIDTVFSSVFETAIAKQAALQLAAELSHPNRAVGFGINHWFTENDEDLLKRLWNSP